MMRGGVKRWLAQRVQSKICTSVPQIEATLTLISTSLRPILGTGTSLYSIPLECFVFTTAFTYRIPYHKTIRWHFSLSTPQPSIVFIGFQTCFCNFVVNNDNTMNMVRHYDKFIQNTIG